MNDDGENVEIHKFYVKVDNDILRGTIGVMSILWIINTLFMWIHVLSLRRILKSEMGSENESAFTRRSGTNRNNMLFSD